MQKFLIPDKERPKLDAFKDYLKTSGFQHSLPDQLLFRYLYTSKFSFKNALNRIQRLIVWRKENNIDHILDNPVIKKNHDIISKRLLYRTHYCDRDGRPCTIFNVGHLNLGHILKQFSAGEILTAHIYYNEYMEKLCLEAAEKLGVDYVGNATIIDLEGLSLSRHMNLKAMNIFKEMILIHTYYYPESSDVVYIVNYPPVFNFFWNIIKPWMTDFQREKLQPINITTKLLSRFDSEYLPRVYGGECECEGGCVLGRANGNIPSPLMDIISLANCEIENVDVAVEERDLIKWYVSSLDKDIDFQVLFISTDGLIHSVAPICSVPCKGSITQGEWKCSNKGTIRLVFDNSKSYWDSCSVSYEINICKQIKSITQLEK